MELTMEMEVEAWDKRIPVTITKEASAIQEWVQRQTGTTFGLDVEWQPNVSRGQNNKVSLLQLCGDSGCLIIQLLFLEPPIPSALSDFLSNPQNRFGGVGIRIDNGKLLEDHGIGCNTVVELAPLASNVTGRMELARAGLKNLSQAVLGLHMDKPQRISRSNWAKRDLDYQQIEYACIDAWVSFAVFDKLSNWQ